MCIGQQTFHRAISSNKLLSGLVTYPWQAGNVIHRITHHSQIINDLRRCLYLKLRLDFFYTPFFVAISHPRGTEHKNIVRNQLSKILIRSHHIGHKSFLFSLFCQCPNDVISLISFLYNRWNIHGFKDTLNIRYCNANRLGSLLSVGLVLRKSLCPCHTPPFVKANCQIIWLLAFNHIKKRIGKSHNGRGIHPFRIDSWVFNKGIIPSKNKCVSIQ